MDYIEKRTFSLDTSSPFLLESICISSVQGIILAMIFALVVAVLFHSLNFVIHFWERHPLKHRRSNLQHCVTTVFHVISAVFAYVMVCCVKTMNIWLFTAIVLGSGIGQLVIGPFVSIPLDKKRLLKKDRESEPLCDYLPEQMSGDATSPRDPTHGDRDRQLDHDRYVSNNRTIPINLDDFIIHKPEHAHQSADKPDADQKSEYDSLNEDFSVDTKAL